jgi:hypothetical protein
MVHNFYHFEKEITVHRSSNSPSHHWGTIQESVNKLCSQKKHKTIDDSVLDLTGTPPGDLAASRPPAGRRRPRHYVGRACGDCTSRHPDGTGWLRPAGSWAGPTELAEPHWSWARRPPSRPPARGHCSFRSDRAQYYSLFFNFQNPLILSIFQKLVPTSKIHRNLYKIQKKIQSKFWINPL